MKTTTEIAHAHANDKFADAHWIEYRGERSEFRDVTILKFDTRTQRRWSLEFRVGSEDAAKSTQRMLRRRFRVGPILLSVNVQSRWGRTTIEPAADTSQVVVMVAPRVKFCKYQGYSVTLNFSAELLNPEPAPVWPEQFR